MRVIPIILFAMLAADAGAARRAPLDLPIRYPDAGPERVPAPAYAGDVVTLRLTAAASRQAWATRAQAARTGPARDPLGLLGVAGLDRAAAELGGVRFRPEFRGAAPGRPGVTDFSAFYVAHLPRGLALETALDRLAALPEVAEVSPVAIVPVSAVPNDSLWSISTWFQQPSRLDIHAPEAWDLTTGDTSIVVGIADTGVLSWHPDLGGIVAGLSGQLFTNWVEAGGVAGMDDDGNGYIDDLHGWDFVALASSADARPGEDWENQDNDPSDYVAHGTGVAGVVGAITDNTIGVSGTTWKVRLMPLRIGWAYANSGLGSGEVRMDFFAEALLYAVSMGVQVVNCSFETVFETGLASALDQAAAAGMVVVAAAGNQARSTETCPTCCQICYLANRPEVIAVASTDANDQISSFSNFGPAIDVAAPGRSIASTWFLRNDSTFELFPTYRTTLTGTSLSAPLVAGGVALLQADRRRLGRAPLLPEAVLLRLVETADDISAQNPTLAGQYGGGRLNLFRALDERWRSDVVRTGSRVNGVAAVIGVNDGSHRIAFVTQDRHLVVLNGATLDTLALATLPAGAVTGVTAGSLGTTAGVGLFVGMNGGVAGFAPDGSVLPGWPALVASGAQLHAGPAIDDLDDDGVSEVVCGDDAGFVHAWHANGVVVDGFPVQVTTYGAVVPVTLARFGNARIIAASEDGRVTALNAGGGVVSGWPVQLLISPTAPVEMTIAGSPTALVVAGGTLHALRPDGTERPGFPVFLGSGVTGREEPAIGDLDQNGHDDIVIACSTPQPRLEARDSTGASLTALNWPRGLGAPPLGSPVLGHVTGGGAPEVMVMLGSGLAAFTRDADSIAAFPKFGGAGVRPSLADLDGDGTTEVVAGSGGLLPRLFVYDAGAASGAPEAQPWPTFRGNFARTGSRTNSPGIPVVDLVAPGGVTDLRAELRDANTVALLWTAPGDDGASGRLPAYEVRRLPQPIDDVNFPLGTLIASGTPADPGMPDSLVLVGLPEGVLHYFALRGRDQGNVGPLSNAVSALLPLVSPGAVSDLRIAAVTDSSVTLAWTATGDDGPVGRPRLYRVHGAFDPIDDGNFATAPYTRIIDATLDGGGAETLLYRFLESGRHYWFALKAFDFAGNSSPLSNVVDATTRIRGPLANREGLALASGRNPSRVPASLYWQAAPEAVGTRHVIHLYDLTGRQVRSFELGTGVGGVARWDGRDDRGNAVAAGLYVVRLTSGSRHVQTRLVLLP